MSVFLTDIFLLCQNTVLNPNNPIPDEQTLKGVEEALILIHKRGGAANIRRGYGTKHSDYITTLKKGIDWLNKNFPIWKNTSSY